MERTTNFTAPTEEIELELINFCIEKLNLPFGVFWYQWFTSANSNNASIHLDCKDGKLAETLRKEFPSLSFFKFFHSGGIKKIDMRHLYQETEFDFKYLLHIKLK